MRYVYFLLILVSTSSIFCQRKLTGIVNDSRTLNPLSGVSVSIKNTNRKVETNNLGQFEIEIKSNFDTVVFSKENYFNELAVVGRVKKMNVGLTKDIPENMVEDSYGSQSLREITSAVSKIEEKNFNKGTNIDIYQMIKGRVPGVYIQHDVANSTSEPVILLRGGSGFGEALQPLIVIDGVQGASLTSVDPVDVSDITVLKDSSAAAIYGNRASSGVIIIKTKRSKNKGK